MFTECQDCGHKFLLEGSDLDNIVSGGGCPSCGSHNVYRTQPNPLESEMAERNMVDPSTGVDAGGNPLQEGIYADTDGGWQPRNKRDESFASVRTAEFDMMDFNFGEDPREATHKFIVSPQGSVYSMPEPVHHEDIADKYKLHDMGYPKGLSLGIKYNDGSTDWLQHENGMAPGQLSQTLESHFGEPVTIDPSIKPSTNEERWGLDTRPRAPSGRPLRELERLYGPASVRSWGAPRDNEGLIRGGSMDRALNMEPYMPWQHLADMGGTSAQVTPGPYGIHAGTVRWLQFFDASVDGLNARQDGQEIIRRFGVRNSPEFGQPVTLQVHYPEHLAAAAQAIEMSANGNQPTPLIKELGAGLKAGTVPFPPGMSPENMRGSSTKLAFLPLLAEAAPLLMRGALMGVGSHMVGGLIPGMGGGGGQAPAAAPAAPAPPAPLPPTVMSKKADLETPSSIPEVGAQAESPEDVDQKEMNDGEQVEQLQGDDQLAGGSLSPDTLEEFDQLLPRVLHYYHMDESAANDPVLRALHEKMEAEDPGYLQRGDQDEGIVDRLLAELRQPHDQITAAGIQPPVVTGPPQPGQIPQATGAPVTPSAGGPCPYCGGVRRADGSCPQCGATASPQGGAILPGQVPPVGTSNPSLAHTAADHQGPTNPEQQKAVAELLLSEGRADEIPQMLVAPWEYADELAQIQNKPNDAPTPNDPTQPPPQPTQMPPMPGGMPGGMPGADPTQQIAAAVARFSADGIAKRCPACGSATTAILNTDGDSRCHACGHIWKDDVVKVKTAERHDHTELHAHPNVEGVPAADQDAQRDVEHEQDSSLSWQTTDGEPLQVGQEYEMHSKNYDVPDIIRITDVKPDAIDFEITGEYDLGHSTEITREEAELEGLTFEPTDGADDVTGDSDDYMNDVADAPRENTVPTQQATRPFTTNVDTHESATTDEALQCPNCTSLHISSQMTSPTTTGHDCYKCGHFWEEHDEEDPGTADDSRAWLVSGSSEPVEEGPAHVYAGLDFVPQQPGKGRNLHEIAQRTAGKKFTPLEQREFIDEQGEARNSDRLDLTGTHYKVREDWTGKANGYNAPDEHMVFGL